MNSAKAIGKFFTSRCFSLQLQDGATFRDRLKSMLDDFDAGGHKQSSGGGGDWQRGQLALKTGVNVISFTVANNRENNDGPTDAILIARIDITGKQKWLQSCFYCTK